MVPRGRNSDFQVGPARSTVWHNTLRVTDIPENRKNISVRPIDKIPKIAVYSQPSRLTKVVFRKASKAERGAAPAGGDLIIPDRAAIVQRRGGAPRGRARLRYWRAERLRKGVPVLPRFFLAVGRKRGSTRVRRSAPAPSRRSIPSSSEVLDRAAVEPRGRGEERNAKPGPNGRTTTSSSGRRDGLRVWR